MSFTSKPRVRIESDGTPLGTRVFVDDVQLTTVTKVSWSLEVDDQLAACTLELVGVDVKLTAEEIAVTKRLNLQGHDPGAILPSETYEEVTAR